MVSIMLGKDLVELEKYPGFYQLCVDVSYAISRSGVVINALTGNVIEGHVIKPNKRVTNMTGGYVTLRINGSVFLRHRLVALMFLPIPEGISSTKKLVVNHLNGVPGDDRVENLEWATYSQNTQHAYDNGLHPNKVVSVLVKDVETGEIRDFPSIAKAARHLGWNDLLIRNRLRRQPGAAYGKFAVKLNDGSEWPLVHLRNLKTGRPVVGYNIFTKEVVVKDTAGKLSTVTGVKAGTITVRLDRGTRRPVNGWLFRYWQENLEWPEFKDDQLLVLKDNPLRPSYGYYVNDVQTGERVLYTRIEKVAERFNTTVPSVEKRVGRSQLYEDRYSVTRFNLFN